MPPFFDRIDRAIERFITQWVARPWQKCTRTPPARLAWVCLGLFVTCTAIDMIVVCFDPHFSWFWRTWVIGWGLATLWIFADVLAGANRLAQGIVPRHQSSFPLDLLRLVRVCMTLDVPIFAWMLGQALFGANPGMSAVLTAGGYLFIWLSFYLVTIRLPPERQLAGNEVRNPIK